MQRNTFTFPAIFLGFIANIYLNETEPEFYVYLLSISYFLLIVFSALDNPVWYALYSTALASFQVVAQLNIQTGRGGIFYLCVMILLYIILALNILIATLLLHYHRKAIQIARSKIRGRWAIIPSDSERKHVGPHTAITFNDDHTGNCIDFYGMESFTYRINPKIGSDTWPYIEFTDRKNKISITLDYQFPSQYNSKLQLGEEYAFEDDFRGYTDDNGQLTLIIEPIYDFKRIFFLIAMVLFCQHSFGQAGNNIIAITIPAQTELDGSQRQNLESIVTDIMTHSGHMSAYKVFGLVMVPSFIIEEESVLQSGANNLYMVNAKLSLNLRNVESGHIFTSISKRYRGTGRNRRAAINNALVAISTSDKDYNDFLKNGQHIIQNYYENNSQHIFQRAALMAQKSQYEPAIALLMSIPEQASCYEEAIKQSEAYYQLYLSSNCTEAIRQARILDAGQNYQEALEFLAYSKIRTTQCAQEANALVDRLERKIADKKREDAIAQKEDAQMRMNLEMHRMNAMMELADKYYKEKVVPVCTE